MMGFVWIKDDAGLRVSAGAVPPPTAPTEGVVGVMPREL